MRWLEMMAASGHVISRRSRRNNSCAQLYGMGSGAWAGMLGSGMAPFHARAVRNARSGRRRG